MSRPGASQVFELARFRYDEPKQFAVFGADGV
jgi:hypothetical protein